MSAPRWSSLLDIVKIEDGITYVGIVRVCEGACEGAPEGLSLMMLLWKVAKTNLQTESALAQLNIQAVFRTLQTPELSPTPRML